MKRESITIALIGCANTKREIPKHEMIPARDLYVSDLFKKRVAHAESRGLPWYILSAGSGLLNPDTPMRPYNKAIGDLTEIEIAEWHLGVANQLMGELFYEFRSPKLDRVTVELHAGERYCDPLDAMLSAFGIRVARPVKGLGIGQQLAYYLEEVTS